ncbi:hypothetical protein C2E20_1245 [Micractinium conductrix]|uniref:Uncharacterized protein n=1 Tax=Micractinium conductrix TaxID=554055 RepID=A0A2P6VN00_9CHLO|nr:hypothetical protein C2E20_1245 [Micractinium conductrix]|eukprot:PSC75482.1 hypothetical protein C2E20_1245 [Micractinium conductrix]
MWGVPDSQEEEFRVVYDDGGGLAAEEEESARAPLPRHGRLRFAFAQQPGSAAAAAKGGGPRAAAAPQGDSSAAPPSTQHRSQAQPLSPAISDGAASPLGTQPAAGGTQYPQATLAQELQTVLRGLTQAHEHRLVGVEGAGEQRGLQQHQQQRQQHQQQLHEEAEADGWQQRRREGARQIAHNSPAVPPSDELPPPMPGRPSSAGRRRWRPAARSGQAGKSGQTRAAGAADAGPALPGQQPANTAAAAAGGASDDFFAVDADLMQAAAQQEVRKQAAAAQRRGQARTVQWDSPQAPPAEHTPQPSQRTNPLAALLGPTGGGGTGSRPRAATTGSKARGRHPIYGHVPSTSALAGTAAAGMTAAAQAAPPTSAQASQGAAAVVAPGSSMGSRLQQLGFRDAPLASPRQAQQRRQAAQHHSRFAFREAAAAPAPAPGSSQHPEAAPTVPVSLRELLGDAPPPAAQQQQQRRQPRQQRQQRRQQRPASPGDDIVEEDGSAGSEGDAAARDAFRTPGQPLRRAWQEEGGEEAPRSHGWEQLEQPLQLEQHQQQQLEQGQQQQQQRAVAAPTPTAGASGTARGGSLQSRFIAQLQPVSSSVAAANMQQQRQRLAGAAGLHARMQAILAAEKAGVAASPGGGADAAVPRLTVLEREFEAHLTKCHCRCDDAAARVLGSPEVVAFLQRRSTRADTTPGFTFSLRPPWRVMPLPGSPWPAVLCYDATSWS